MKKLIISLMLVFITGFSSATHILGGDIQVEQISNNHFRVSLKMFRYCHGMVAPDSLRDFRVYDKTTNTLLQKISIQKDSSRNVVIGCDSSNFQPCIETHFYSRIINLPNNLNGYFMTYVHCCGKGNSTNVASDNGSRTWRVSIPDPALLGKNNSPKFGRFPVQAFVNVASSVKQIDLSCIDVDGDSLAYSFIPISTTGDTNKPFSSGSYNPGYSFGSIFGVSGTSTLNSATGMFSARSQLLGNFIVVLKCEEFRNGVKIGEVIREFTIVSLNCFKINGIDKNNIEVIKVFPNPSSSDFSFLELPQKYSKYYVLNPTGEIIKSGQINASENKISLIDYPSGIYFIQIIADEQLYRTRVIKQ